MIQFVSYGVQRSQASVFGGKVASPTPPAAEAFPRASHLGPHAIAKIFAGRERRHNVDETIPEALARKNECCGKIETEVSCARIEQSVDSVYA